MMKLRSAFLALFFVSITMAQVPEQIQRYRSDAKGDIKNRLQGIADGNRIRTLFYNNGEVARWQYRPSLEWPKGSGHQYLDGYTFMVGAQVTAPGNGQVIHPLETSYREEMPMDPVTRVIWGFEPVEGYANPSGMRKIPAMSNDPNSYPAVWPSALGLSADWNGQWYGYAGKGASEGVLESFYVMDDSKDGKYKRFPYLYYPIAADSDRGGLGLRVEVRSMQFRRPALQDMLFWHYSVTNLSDRDYDSTAFGIFTDPGVGGDLSANDNASSFSTADLVYMWDYLGKGDPTVGGTWKTGYAGLGILSSPVRVNGQAIGSLSITPLADKGPTGVWPKNNENMWRKMTGGFVDTGIVNSNISVVIGSNLFGLHQWTSEAFDVAMVMGNDLPELVMKKFLAQAVRDNNFTLPDTLSTLGPVKVALHSPTGPGTVSGTVNVSWDVQGAVGKTVSSVYASMNGIDWTLIGSDETGSNTLAWNTALFPDGIFYTLRIITLADNGFGIIESAGRFTVNNPGAAWPEVRFAGLAENPVFKEQATLAWEGGDADGDASRVNLYYKLAQDIAWTPIASGLDVSAGACIWDTRSVPNSGAHDYQLKAEIVSNTDTTSAFTSGISIDNPIESKPGTSFTVSKRTNGTGAIDISIADASAVTGHSYLLTFSNSAAGLTAAVTDLSTGVRLLTGIGPLDGLHESKTFDGIRLRIASDLLALDPARTGWVNATSAFPIAVTPDASFAGLNLVKPYDYQFTFSNAVVDTSEGDLDPGFPPVFLRFSVKNVTLNTRPNVLVKDLDNSGTLTKGDNLKILEEVNGEYFVPWNLVYGSMQSNAPEPTLGDVYMIATKKPFAQGDSITITTKGLTGVERVTSPVPEEFALFQNYPNPFNPATTIRFSIPSAQMVDVTIYDVLGKEMASLVHEKLPAGKYSVRFDGAALSSGMYFYRLTAGSFTSTRKFLLVK